MLGPEERDRIEAAVRQAERGTAGEIVVVLARQAASYRSVLLSYGLAVALVVPWPLIAFTPWPALDIFVVQIAAAGCALLVGSGFPLAVIPRSVKRSRAREAAAREFLSRGMQDTRGRTGILLYVAVAERYAEVVGDVTISERVSEAEWRAVINALVETMDRGPFADAVVAAVEAIGVILARHVPPGTDDPDELPNRVVFV